MRKTADRPAVAPSNCHGQPNAPITASAIVLVGNPNVGKSALFGALTGRYVEVSNFPGTTVELATGQVDGLPLIDTPGVQQLMAHSDDERVTRDILLDAPARVIVQVADARNLRRGLLLTLQLAELGQPFVLDVNMTDEARARGLGLDTRRLAQILGAEVVETVAVRNTGIGALRAAFAAARPVAYRFRYDGALENAIEQISQLLPPREPGARALALMILAGDTQIAERFAGAHPAELQAILAATADQYEQPLAYAITQQRLRCADCLVAQVVRSAPRAAARRSWAEWFGRVSVHPVWGWPILAVVLVGLYLFVGQFGAGLLVAGMEGVVFGQWINPLATRLVSLLPVPFLVDLLVGPYGLITMALTYGLAIVMPIVLTFFLAFSVLEDSGYLPRLAVMMDRPFKSMGLNGKAVLPMVLGLGCDTMATLTTRILETRKDRVVVTLLLALGVPCSAQLGVLLGMMAYLPPAAIAVWAGVVVSVMFGVGWLAAQVIPGRRSEFILELPPIRRPQLGNIVIKTLARLEWYLKEVLPLFVLGTLILFGLSRTGALDWLERLAAPLVQAGLGLPRQTTAAFIIGFLRRDYGAAGIFAMARAGQLTTLQLLISLIVITLFVPCIANVLIIVKEHGWRTAAAVAGFVFPFAFTVGAVLNLVFQWAGVTFR